VIFLALLDLFLAWRLRGSSLVGGLILRNGGGEPKKSDRKKEEDDGTVTESSHKDTSPVD